MTSDVDEVAAALAHALTGQDLPVTTPEVADLVDELAALGWDATRVQELRRTRMAARRPWPFGVPVAVQRGFGFARFAARLVELRAALGLSGQLDTAPAAPRSPDRDEQRLLADRPPHWG